MILKKKTILTSIMILFVFSSFSLASAAEGWELEESDNLYYYVEVKEDGGVLAKGIVSFTVDDITSLSLRFNISADFSGSSAITYREVFEDKDDTILFGTSINFAIFIFDHPAFFIKEDKVDDFAVYWQGIVDIYDIMPNYTIDANLQDSEWYLEITYDNSDYLEMRDMKYTPEGILKSYKYHYISSDGTTEQEFFIEKSILPFKSPIAVPNLYVYIAAGVLGLVIILIVGAIFKKKK
ncbi:MAG: hypothetical protein ACTSXN_00010 [Promethearchaeota archaeon]